MSEKRELPIAPESRAPEPVTPDSAIPESPESGESPEPAGPEIRSWRLISTLGIAGALAGLAIVLVFGWAEPRIKAHRAAALRAAVEEVLGAPQSYATLFVIDGSLSAELPAGADSASFDQIYVGYDADGRSMGFAIPGEQPGYQDIIGLIFGYDAEADRLLGMKVLESKETPGLGDKIEKDSSFVRAFRGVVPPIEGVKAGRGEGKETEVDMITGATISSRTVIEIINRRMETVGPMIEAYMQNSAGSDVVAAKEGA